MDAKLPTKLKLTVKTHTAQKTYLFMVSASVFSPLATSWDFLEAEIVSKKTAGFTIGAAFGIKIARLWENLAILASQNFLL